MSTSCQTHFLLALLVVAAMGCQPRAEVLDRTEWPSHLVKFIASSNLSAKESDHIEAVLTNGFGDGWFLRMPRSENAERLVTQQWIPIEESEVGDSAAQGFWQRMPKAWKPQRGDQASKMYIHPRYNPQEDGNGTAFVGLIDDDYVYVWFYFNF
jgi:hypothetical protein